MRDIDCNIVFSTKQQEWLLQAALLEEDAAIDAWERWQTATNFDDYLDNGSYRLLPLLYKNLHRHHVVDPCMNRFKGVYRLVWYENQRKFHEIGKILVAFHEADIPTLLLKGAALTLLHYRDNGVRPMADIDVLVPTDKARSAITLLTSLGWTPMAWETEACLRYQHSMSFKNQFGQEFDLHWHVFYECCEEKADIEFWQNAVVTNLHDVSTLALDPTDTLLHVIVHGIKWNPEPPIRWIADAMTVLKASEAGIDWTRLVEQAHKRRLSFQLKVGLQYLQDAFHASIPTSGIRAINAMPISRIERIEFRYHTRPEKIRQHMLLGTLPLHLMTYLRFTNGMGLLHALAELPAYFRYCLQARDLGHLMFLLLTKSIRRIKIALGPNM